jgi:hypothetical protein
METPICGRLEPPPSECESNLSGRGPKHEQLGADHQHRACSGSLQHKVERIGLIGEGKRVEAPCTKGAKKEVAEELNMLL